MKKIIIILLVLSLMLCVLSGCGNRTVIDTRYTFNKAIIYLPNGEAVEGNVKNWHDYDDSDIIQITLDNGNTYYTHSVNVCLIAEN
jgi:hypothetical protein